MRYALFADLAGRDVLVVGAGAVAERKIRGLLSTGARVTVVAPETSTSIREWANQGRLILVERPFEKGDAAGKALVFAASDVPEVNGAAAKAAKDAGAWVNRADDPEAGDFHVPALLTRGDVSVAVATGGGSPALAAWLRDRVGEALPEETARLAAICTNLREALPEGRRKEASALFGRLFASEGARALLEGDEEAARRAVDSIFGEGSFERAGKVREE